LQVKGRKLPTRGRTSHRTHEEHFESGSLDRTTFDVDSLVLVNYGDSKYYQPPTKFHSFWRGPWRVVEIDSEDPNRYTLEHLVTLKKRRF
jgi:hypothetical protein